MNCIYPKYFPVSFPKKCEHTLNWMQNIPMTIFKKTYRAIQVINKDPNKCW